MSFKRITSAVAGATALALAVTGCGGSSSASSRGGKPHVTIMVGGLDKQIYLPAMLAKQLGYFDQAGITVDLRDEPAGVDAETAMLSGQVDAAVGFYDHNIQLQAKGKSTESIVQFSQVPGEVEIASSKHADAANPSTWAGQNVGITGAGSSTDFLTQYLATKNGVPAAKVNRLAVKAGQTFVAALQHDQIVAGMTTEPTITKVVDSGLGTVAIDMRTVEGTQQALGGLYPAACLYTTTKWAESHKDAATRLAKAFKLTLEYINTHSGADIASHMPADYYSGVGKEKYAAALDAGKAMFTKDGRMPQGGPDTVLQVLKAALPDVAKADIDLSKTYTTEYVDAAK